ncbi:hypothetical protein D3C73_1446080 [compost metagenome]
MIGSPEAAALVMQWLRSVMRRRSEVRTMAPVVPAAAVAVARLTLPYPEAADIALAVRIDRQPVQSYILVAA